jgi:hypothetical protein
MDTERGMAIQTDQEEKENLKNALERNFDNDEIADELKQAKEVPLIMGQFTDWQP